MLSPRQSHKNDLINQTVLLLFIVKNAFPVNQAKLLIKRKNEIKIYV